MVVGGMCEEQSEELKDFLEERRYSMLFILSLRFSVLVSLCSSFRPSSSLTSIKNVRNVSHSKMSYPNPLLSLPICWTLTMTEAKTRRRVYTIQDDPLIVTNRDAATSRKVVSYIYIYI